MIKGRKPKRGFRKQYPWAFRTAPQTPYAFALPKRKKDFLGGRPIISFVRAFTRPLLEATARLVFQLTSIAFPESFASGDVYDLLSRIKTFFSTLQNPDCAFDLQDLGCRNQDLSGFFTSVSREQLMLLYVEAVVVLVPTKARRRPRYHLYSGSQRNPTSFAHIQRGSKASCQATG